MCMNLEELREILGMKIYLEYEVFKQTMTKKSTEEVYENAYQIDSYINLYEFLLELSRELGEEDIVSILLIPNVLTFLYDEWLSFEDSRSEDLCAFIRKEISKLNRSSELEVA